MSAGEGWRTWLRQAFEEPGEAEVRDEQQRALLVRSRAAAWVAAAVVGFTIFIYDYAFFPDVLAQGLLIAALAEVAIFTLIGLLGRGVFNRWPGVALFLLLGVICNATQAAQLAITGGAVNSNFFFPYYLINFGIAAFFPASWVIVFMTTLILPLGYLALGLITGVDLGEEAFVSNLVLLVDYALITVIANRVITASFLRELRLRLDLERANVRLRELDRSKTEFFSNISHELRTPLTLILAPATALREAEVTPEQRQLVDEIRRNAARLLGLINDLLLIARIESGRVERRHEHVDVQHVVSDVVGSMRSYAEWLGVTLEVAWTGEASSRWYGDARHLERILLNLLSNACKFSKSGGTVQVRVIAELDGELIMEVTDEGIGIAADDIPKLFNRFVQLDRGDHRRFEGTGIGLALVKELAELHAGRVEVESELGRGSTFRVLLPRAGAPATDARSTENEPSALRTFSIAWGELPSERPPAPGMPVGKAPATGRRPRLLIVEDNDSLLTFLTNELGRSFDVLGFPDPSAAVELAVRDVPDLILSDVMMPRIDGIELTRRLRNHPRTRDVPILLMSARDDVESKLRGFEAGVDDYVAKPFQLPELRARIDAHLRLRAQTTALTRTVGELDGALKELKQAEAMLLEHERMAVLGKVVAGVAHEINNPVHFIKGNLVVLGQMLAKMQLSNQSEVTAIFNDLQMSCTRLSAVTAELLALGRKDSESRKSVVLHSVAEFAIRMLRPQLGPGARIHNALSGDERVLANQQDVFQILLNLLQNAVHAVDPKHGEIVVEASRGDGAVELRIRDNGVGIPPENMERIFEPFFTTKPPGKGTGLGLALVTKLARAQNGSVVLESQPGKGTVAKLRLPERRSP